MILNTSGDAAEQIVRLSLEGFEVSAKIAGSGAKEVAVLLYTVLKNKSQTSGKTKLLNLLKSGKELRIFTIKHDDLKKFSEKAKDYGILYSALINKKEKSSDGMVDIVVKAEDAARINRIVDRFKLSSYDETVIRGAVEAKRKEKDSLNPHLAKTEKSPQSEHSSKTQKNLDQGTRVKISKPSVKSKLRELTKEAEIRNTKEQNSILMQVNLKKKGTKDR